jgi:hypothetical protein
LLAGAEFCRKSGKNSVIHGLYEMGVETRLLGSAALFVLPPDRQRYQQRAALPASLIANSTSGLVPVEYRHMSYEFTAL